MSCTEQRALVGTFHAVLDACPRPLSTQNLSHFLHTPNPVPKSRIVGDTDGIPAYWQK
jgi:hypothetical protein